MLHIFRFVAGSDDVSWHKCTEEAYSSGSLHGTRTCHFKRVCINRDSGLIEYHAPEQTERLASDILGKPLITDAWNEQKLDAAWYPDTPRFETSVVLVPTKFPSATVHETVVYTDPVYPGNFGHALGEYGLSAYRLLNKFQLLDSKVQVIYQNRNCSDYKNEPHACAIEQDVTRTFSDRPPFKLQNRTTGSICMQDLVVGTASLTMSLGPDTDAAFDRYVQHIAHQHVADNVIKAQRLLLFRKHGKRRIINIEQIQAHLISTFKVDVDVIDISHLTFPEQIKQVRNASIVISPCGGLSFSSVFLPAGGVAIFPGYWDPVANSSANMEEYIYNRFTTFSTMYYNVDLHEISVDAAGAGFEERSKYRDYGSTILNLDKLT